MEMDRAKCWRILAENLKEAVEELKLRQTFTILHQSVCWKGPDTNQNEDLWQSLKIAIQFSRA